MAQQVSHCFWRNMWSEYHLFPSLSMAQHVWYECVQSYLVLDHDCPMLHTCDDVHTRRIIPVS